MPPSNRYRAFGALILLLSAAAAAQDIERSGGPYVPTPQGVVDAMLDAAKVGPQDFVVDLGSGDGRIVLTAAQRYKARGLGFDIDPELVKQSNAEAQKRGLSERVSFVQQDVLKAKISDASVVTLYLLPGMMQQLQAKFVKELKPGTRIVSHDFPFSDWKPDRQTTVDVPEKYGTPGNWTSTIYYWVVPAHVQGTWRLTAPEVSAEPVAIVFDQQYQVVRGASVDGGKAFRTTEGKLDGGQISFKVKLPSGAWDFRGVVEGGRMRGEAVQGSRAVAWSAQPVAAARQE